MSKAKFGIIVPALLALLGAGCAPLAETPEARSRRVLAQVIDEFPAQAAQVEGEALGLVWEQLAAQWDKSLPAKPPPLAEVLSAPGKHRGEKMSFKGKLMAVTNVDPLPGSRWARFGRFKKGLVLLPEGGLVAFHAWPGQVDLRERVLKVGEPVKITGHFLKRWAALDAAGRRSVEMPLLACAPPAPLAGKEAEVLNALRPPPGLLPLTEIEVPPVWSRPVVELDARGRLRLDGRTVSREALGAELVRQAAAEAKTPLGESALVAVVLLDPAAPAAEVEALRKALPVKAIFRTGR